MNRQITTLAAFFLLLATNIQAADSEGNWEIAVGEDSPSYEVVASMQQASANTIKDEYATKDVNPQLAFRCLPGNPVITARIDWRRFISSFNTEVGFKVDDGKALWLKWGVDQTNKITMSKSASDSQSLIDYLSGGSKLQVEVSPYSESSVTIDFDLLGFTEGLEKLQAECQ